jgi:hypothetical protein
MVVNKITVDKSNVYVIKMFKMIEYNFAVDKMSLDTMIVDKMT